VYLPAIRNARPVDRIPIDQHHVATLCDEITADGPVEYIYVLIVRRRDGTEPAIIVSLETSSIARQMAAASGGGPPEPFLCAFAGDSHLNYGTAPECLDIAVFRQRAADRAREHLLREAEGAGEG
jgi:hypothetical protein